MEITKRIHLTRAKVKSDIPGALALQSEFSILKHRMFDTVEACCMLDELLRCESVNGNGVRGQVVVPYILTDSGFPQRSEGGENVEELF
jgi:hypothetical protein